LKTKQSNCNICMHNRSWAP